MDDRLSNARPDLHDAVLVEIRDSWGVLYDQVGGLEKYESAGRNRFVSSERYFPKSTRNLPDRLSNERFIPRLLEASSSQNSSDLEP